MSQSQSVIKKQAFEASQVEAKAFGQRFQQLLHHNLDLLGTVFQSSLTDAQASADRALSAVPDALGAVWGSYDPKTKIVIRTSRAMAKPDVLAKSNVISSELNLSDSAVASILSSSGDEKEIFTRFANDNRKPLIAIARLSPQGPGADGFVPFAAAIFSVKALAEEKTSNELSIIFRESKVLLSTDFNLDRALDLSQYKHVLGARTAMSQWVESQKAGTGFLSGIVPVDSSISVVFQIKAASISKKDTETEAKTLFVAFLFLGFAVGLSLYFSKSIFGRVSAFTGAVKSYLDGSSVEPISISGNDEIAALGTELNRIPETLASLKEKHREEFRQESEKIISAAVQQTLIPPDRFRSPMISIRSHYQPASEFSGDWWGFFGVGQKLCILIGDCTGRGFQSALMTAAVRSCFSVMHKLAVENEEFSYSPGAMLSYANRSVFDTSSGRAAMTLFASVIDFSTGRMTYASAGHNPPWLFHRTADGSYTPVSLVSRGQRLGEARNVPDFHEEAVQIHKGDILFMYTDGLIDALGPKQERFGKMRTRKIVEEGLSKGPEAIIAKIKSEIDQFAQGVRPDDDITFTCVEFLPDGKNS